MKTLHFETRATRLMESATLKNSKEAQAWCLDRVQGYAKALENEGAEIFWSVGSGLRFSTDGGDEGEAAWNWLTDETDSPVYCEFRVREF